ncbi:MAG: hypothetical protein AAB581_01825 [Patescibacteria group bacterium]
MKLDIANAVTLYAPAAVSMVMLAWAGWHYIKGTLTVGTLKKLLWFFAAFLVVLAAAKIIVQYYAYKTDPFGKLFLPPYQSLDWFTYSMWKNHIAPVLFAAIAGILTYGAARGANRFFKRELFVEYDTYILLLAALIVSWPNYVVYCGIVALLTVLILVWKGVKQKNFSDPVVITGALLAGIPLALLLGNAATSYFVLWKLTI